MNPGAASQPTAFLKSRWGILLILFVARTGLGFQFQTLGSVSGELISDLQLNYREVGTLIGLFTVAGIFLSMPVGMALRFTTERVLSAGGLLCLSIGGFASAAAAGFDLIAIGRLICGIGFVLSTVYLTKMISDWFAGYELATALGILMMSWPIGIALAQVIQPWVALSFGWNTAFYTSGFYCLIAGALITAFYRSPQVEASAPTTDVINRLTPREFKLTLIASTVWACFNAGYIVYLSFSQIMLQTTGMGAYEAASLSSLPSWIMIIATIIAGQLADRTGKRDTILYIGMAAAVAGMLLLTVTNAALPAVLLFGLIGAAPVGVIMALTAESMPANARAYGIGVFFTCYFIVVTPAPIIAGWLYDTTLNPKAPIIFAAVLFALTALFNVIFRRAQQRW